MNKTEVQKIADGVFKRNPAAKKVFITSDGNAFFSENSRNLHINTNRGGKKISFVTVENGEFKAASKEGKLDENKPKTLSQMNKTELLAVAKEKKIDVSGAKNNKAIVALIKDVKVKKSPSNEKKDEKPLSEMNETLLTELAVSKGIEVPEGAEKAVIIKLIEAVVNAKIKK